MPDNSLIIFLSPKEINKNIFLPSAEPVTWVYLGKKFHEKAKIERDLGAPFHCLDIARMHNDVADTIRHEFVGWIDELNRLNGTSLEWWWGPVSSRNVYRSNVFQYCCYIEILERIWKDASTRPAFVIVESAALAKTLQKWGSDRKIPVSFQGMPKIYAQSVWDYCIYFLRWANFIGSVSLRKCAAMVLTGTSENVKERCIIIHTYLHPASVSDTGVFSDRYFLQLYDFLGNRGKNIVVLPTLHGFKYNYLSLFFRIRKSKTQFAIPERYLNISDYLHAFYYPFHLIREKIRSQPFRRIDFTEILREDTIKDTFEDSLEAILFYRLTERLKNAGINPEFCIDWYENQPINRALLNGFRRHFVGVPLVGAQIFLHYPNFLSLSPAVSEIEASMVPDQLLETSSYQCKMATMFAPHLPCKPCAALRYAQLFKKAKRMHPDAFFLDKNTILLLASFDIEETLELLSQVQSILPNLGDDVRVMIKLHPDMEKESITRHYGNGKWPEKITIVTGTLSEAMDHASIVISKSSGSIVEAAAEGIPVIFLGNQTKLNFNPLAGIDLPGISECYTTGELEISIKKFLSLSSEEMETWRESGSHLRDLFFTDINETTLSAFLN